MMRHSAPDDDPGDATRIFVEYLADLPDGAAPEPDALARAHPTHAEALHTLCAEWRLGAAALGDRDAGTVHITGDGADDSTWRRFLDQLRSRGPGHTRYVLKGELARGGMGVIQRVFDQDAQRPLAMKVMLGQGDLESTGDTPSVDDKSLGRFLEEAQVTSQLDHPGIVPVHEIGIDAADRVYFTMKLVKGEDLRAVFDHVHDPNDDSWTMTRALNVLLRVCEAMAYAHEKGVIHRDLKPGNVMVGRFGEVYVMDWGLARVLGQKDAKDLRIRPESTSRTVLKSERRHTTSDTPDDALLTMDGDVVGTPAYMPPEQAEGRIEAMGPPADVYAMGAMLYHLLSGHMPYAPPGSRKSPRMILAELGLGPPAPIGDEARDAPPELLAICEKAMARRIGSRYPDMTALARDLRAFLEQRVVAAYESGAWAEAKKWIQRNQALSATAAAAMLAVLALSGWAVVERGNARANEASARLEATRADDNAKIATTRAEDAEREKNRANDNAALATARADDVLRLSDARRLAELKTEMDTLWPAYPDKLDAMRKWLDKAKELVDKLPGHEQTLAELRRKGTPMAPGPPGEDLTAKEKDLTELREHLATHAGNDPDDGFDDAARRAQHVAEEHMVIAALESELRALRAVDEQRRERERRYDFGDDVDAGWWHDTVQDLVMDLHAIQANDRHGETIASVAWRMGFAETVGEQTISGAEVVGKWAEAREAIESHPRYGGLDLRPQVGLVPLGADPESTLWEFWHVQSGDRPERDPATGRWEITGETGIVLVLIPGGTYTLGAQKDDPAGPNYDEDAQPDESDDHDQPVEVVLAPYFIARYEMTQGQWQRITGATPSNYRPGSRFGDKVTTLAHPVEQVSGIDCDRWLGRIGLGLPTEAQWESAARAGTDSPRWTGRDLKGLDEAGNVADRFAHDNGFPSSFSYEADLNDGYTVHAPVGSFSPNRFGLHDTIGNVWEWCRDGFGAYSTPPQPGDAERLQQGATLRVYRGGSFIARVSYARSAYRRYYTPAYRNDNLGCRPARGLSP